MFGARRDSNVASVTNKQTNKKYDDFKKVSYRVIFNRFFIAKTGLVVFVSIIGVSCNFFNQFGYSDVLIVDLIFLIVDPNFLIVDLIFLVVDLILEGFEWWKLH